MSVSPRIALIHATTMAVEPIRHALAAGWPEARTCNILDDSLSGDRQQMPDDPDAMAKRILDLARYARSTGAEGILYTCSAFGDAIRAAASEVDVPVLRPNEAMFEEALRYGSRIAMIVTFPPAQKGMEQEFAEHVAESGAQASLKTMVAESAIDALRAGDEAAHNRIVAEAVAGIDNADAIMLAHFSTSRAAEAASARTPLPILTSPDAAVAKLKGMVGGGPRTP